MRRVMDTIFHGDRIIGGKEKRDECKGNKKKFGITRNNERRSSDNKWKKKTRTVA